PVDEFYTWVNQWRTASTTAGPGSTTGDLARVPNSFGICLACHKINGTTANVAPDGIESPPTSGPNLTLFGCRETLAAGLLVNNEENLRAWLRDPGAIKEDNWMATVIQPGTLSEEQIDELVEYLYTLRPAEGCAGGGAPGVVSGAVATPAA
nr:c-type cytochrome [Chloroflexota bacterium]